MKINIQGEPAELDGLIPHGVLPLIKGLPSGAAPSSSAAPTTVPSNFSLPRIPSSILGIVGATEPVGSVSPRRSILGTVGIPAAMSSAPRANEIPDAADVGVPGGMQLPQEPRTLLGKIGHGIERVGKTAGEIAGSAFIPTVMPYIPGTTQSAAREEREAEQKALAGATTSQREAEAGLEQAEAGTEPVKAQTGLESAEANLYKAQNPQPTIGTIESKEMDAWLQENPGKSAADFLAYKSELGKGGSVPQQEMESWLKANPGKTPNDYMAYLQTLKPPNVFAEWRKEHPNASVEEFWKEQTSMRPEFPRIQPVTDAKGNIRGWATFTGTAGGVQPGFIPVSGVSGVPQNLGSEPGVIPPKPTSTVLTQSQRAEMIQPQAQALREQINKVAPELGPLKGRWADIITGKVGANNPDIAKLQMQLQMFTTALMLAHGLRGEQYANELGRYLSAAQSPENLIERINGANAYLEDYAAETGHGPKSKTTENKPSEGGNISDKQKAIDSILKKVGIK